MIEVVEEYYRDYYSCVHGGGCTGAANRALHRHIEKPWAPADKFACVLELGAGACQHFGHVRHSFDVYIATDIRRNTELVGWDEIEPGFLPTDGGRYFSRVDAHKLLYPDASFDRLLATCLLLHLIDPYGALVEWRRVTRPGGVLDILLPCDPGVAVRAFRALFSRRRAEKLGCTTFDLVNALEHRNHTYGMMELARYVFRHDDLGFSWRPFPMVPSWNLNTHVVLRIRRRA